MNYGIYILCLLWLSFQQVVSPISCVILIIVSLYTVPASYEQSGVTVIQSDDNQPRQDDKRSQVEHTKGLYIGMHLWNFVVVHGTLKGDYDGLA